jgi:hypothetical protein
MHELKKLVDSVTAQLYATSLIRCILLSVAVYLPMLAISPKPSVWPVVAAVLAFIFGLWQTGLTRNKKQQAISLIHTHVGHTEYSLHLLDKEELNLAEQLQLERLGTMQVTFPFRRLYKNLSWYAGFLAVSIVFYMAYPWITFGSKAAETTFSKSSGNLPIPVADIAPLFENAEVKVTPPAYTKLTQETSSDLNVSAIAGSAIRWEVQFSHKQRLVVKLANSRGEEVTFSNHGDGFEYTDKLTGSGLYALKAYWKDSLIYQSDFYRLEAIPDLPPKIEPASKELYQYHFLKDSKSIKVAAKMSDDFLVKQAFIVATVARGSGENVKFREMKFPLMPKDFKEANLQKILDLKALDFTPGDELYYYWAAVDNRQPEANFSKSDTYFVVYKDTAQIEEAELATMAVNIMPEYFRSQRQIIIDTEKLIAKKKKLSKKEFSSISNEIGFDQKVLRLRYGQYLGEEFETSLGGAAGPPADGEVAAGSILDAFTHKSDGEGEAAERRATETGHDHDHGHDHGHSHDHGGSESEAKDPLAALMEQYVHAHDDAETNTFYEQSTRSLLKMALENMWQSELHLRMYEPEKAIPYENKALEFLKSAQHKARTFVKKSGYDPPPIKEKEKRLTGEMKDLNINLSSEKEYKEKTTGQLVSEILGYLETDQKSTRYQGQVQVAGSVLAERLLNSGPFNGGLDNWKVLASLQKLVSGKPLSAREKVDLKTELYKRTDPMLERNEGYRGEKKLEGTFWKMMQ